MNLSASIRAIGTVTASGPVSRSRRWVLLQTEQATFLLTVAWASPLGPSGPGWTATVSGRLAPIPAAGPGVTAARDAGASYALTGVRVTAAEPGAAPGEAGGRVVALGRVRQVFKGPRSLVLDTPGGSSYAVGLARFPRDLARGQLVGVAGILKARGLIVPARIVPFADAATDPHAPGGPVSGPVADTWHRLGLDWDGDLADARTAAEGIHA